MRALTLEDLANADLVQIVQGSIWAVSSLGVAVKLDFWPSPVGGNRKLADLLPGITAWRENGRNGTTFGRWHNLGAS